MLDLLNPQKVASILANSNDESITLLRDLIEKLSTKEGKNLRWETLVELIEQEEVSVPDSLAKCISNGGRVIRELPARPMTVINGGKDQKPTFRFEVPYSMRCLPDVDLSNLAQKKDIDEICKNDSSVIPHLRDVDRRERGKVTLVNKKRKSLREQSYAKQSDQIKQILNNCEEEGEESQEDEDQHDFDGFCDDVADMQSRCCHQHNDDEKGCDDDQNDSRTKEVKRQAMGWHRRQGLWQPFSQEVKKRKIQLIKRRLRERRFKKMKNSAFGPPAKSKSSRDETASIGTTASVESGEKRGGNRKPSRVERRTAALRKDSGKPSLAELRARNGKSSPLLPLKTPSILVSTTPSHTEAPIESGVKTTIPTAVIVKVPTCKFTFTSQSMTANRLESMRAELERLRKNLEDARKEFEDLQGEANSSEKQKVISRIEKVSATQSGVAKAMNSISDKLKQSSDSLTALKLEAKGVISRPKQQQQQISSPNITKQIRDLSTSYAEIDSLEMMSKSTRLSPKMERSSLKMERSSPKMERKVSNCSSTPSRVDVNVNVTVSGDKIDICSSTHIDGKLTCSSQMVKSPPPPLPPPIRRKKADISNIHHISNHKPSRRIKDGLSNSLSLQDETMAPGLDHPTTTTSLFSDEWICVFCEYKLLYGEYPRMLGAVKSRRSLISKKKDAQERAHRATTIGAPSLHRSRNQCTCGRAHAKAMEAVAKIDLDSNKKEILQELDCNKTDKEDRENTDDKDHHHLHHHTHGEYDDNCNKYCDDEHTQQSSKASKGTQTNSIKAS